jgi:hypothetical protein
VEDLRARLADFPEADLEGLWAVGLVPSTRKDCSANGRYYPGEKPVIHIYSWAPGLVYRQPLRVKGRDMGGFVVERAFGMRVEQAGNHWCCRWEPEDLRRFILDHVLPHEIGHHVDYLAHRREGRRPVPRCAAREQFAEAYALRFLRERGRILPETETDPPLEMTG